MWHNINKLSVLLQPILLRHPVLMTYLFCLIKPLEGLLYNWQKFREDNIYKLSHNGQICYLRKTLNDRFDLVKRRIIITDGNRYKRNYIYTEPEKKDKYLGTMYLRQDSDYEDSGVDFIVLVPSELLDKNNYEMKALIDYYKMASKRYKIQPLE
jgi:hypothetical protein